MKNISKTIFVVGAGLVGAGLIAHDYIKSMQTSKEKAPENPDNIVDGASKGDAETPVTPIDSIGLSPSVSKQLIENGVETLEAALAMEDEEILKIPGVGPKSLEAIKSFSRS